MRGGRGGGVRVWQAARLSVGSVVVDADERQRVERAVRRGEVVEGRERATYAVDYAQQFLSSPRGRPWLPLLLLVVAGYATVLLVVSLFSDGATLTSQLLLAGGAVVAGLAAAFGFRRRQLVLAAVDGNLAQRDGTTP